MRRSSPALSWRVAVEGRLPAPTSLYGVSISERFALGDLLILDEFGYLPADPEIGPVLYVLIATRYERKALAEKSVSLPYALECGRLSAYESAALSQ